MRRHSVIPSLRCVLFLLSAVCTLLATGCAGRQGRGASTPGSGGGTPEELAGMRIETTAGGEVRVYDDEDLFRVARASAAAGRCPEAVATYEQLVADFPASRFASASLYNAALCLVRSDDLRGAAERYARLVREYPESSDLRPARFQLAMLYERLEAWSELVAVADALLAEPNLSVDDRVEALARRSQGLFGQGEPQAAAEQAQDVLRYVRRRPPGEEVGSFYFVAAANFVLAETIRLQFDAAPIPPGDTATQRAALEARAQHLLDAQRTYFDTMRWSDPYWTSAAGYQIGSLYDRFFHSILAAPVPPASEPLEGPELASYERDYRVALAEYVEPLLRHSIRYWELTLQMIERTGVDTEWRERIETDLARVRQQLASLFGS